MDAIKARITEWASHVRGYDQIGAVANVIENGIEKHHAKGLECEAAWRAIEEAVVAEIAKELHRMRDRGSSDYVFRRVAELRGNCRRCGYGKREHHAQDGGGCAGDFAEQLPAKPIVHHSDAMFPESASCGIKFDADVKRSRGIDSVTCRECIAIERMASEAAGGGA